MDLPSSAPLKQKIGMSVVNYTNFPYETNRRFNNNTMQLSEAENLKSKLQALTKQGYDIQNNLQEARK